MVSSSPASRAEEASITPSTNSAGNIKRVWAVVSIIFLARWQSGDAAPATPGWETCLRQPPGTYDNFPMLGGKLSSGHSKWHGENKYRGSPGLAGHGRQAPSMPARNVDSLRRRWPGCRSLQSALGQASPLVIAQPQPAETCAGS